MTRSRPQSQQALRRRPRIPLRLPRSLRPILLPSTAGSTGPYLIPHPSPSSPSGSWSSSTIKGNSRSPGPPSASWQLRAPHRAKWVASQWNCGSATSSSIGCASTFPWWRPRPQRAKHDRCGRRSRWMRECALGTPFSFLTVRGRRERCWSIVRRAAKPRCHGHPIGLAARTWKRRPQEPPLEASVGPNFRVSTRSSRRGARETWVTVRPLRQDRTGPVNRSSRVASTNEFMRR